MTNNIKKDFSEFTRIMRKKVILTTVNIEDIEKSRVSNKVEEERYPETFRRLRHHQSGATKSEGRFLEVPCACVGLHALCVRWSR